MFGFGWPSSVVRQGGTNNNNNNNNNNNKLNNKLPAVGGTTTSNSSTTGTTTPSKQQQGDDRSRNIIGRRMRRIIPPQSVSRTQNSSFAQPVSRHDNSPRGPADDSKTAAASAIMQSQNRLVRPRGQLVFPLKKSDHHHLATPPMTPDETSSNPATATTVQQYFDYDVLGVQPLINENETTTILNVAAPSPSPTKLTILRTIIGDDNEEVHNDEADAVAEEQINTAGWNNQNKNEPSGSPPVQMNPPKHDPPAHMMRSSSLEANEVLLQQRQALLTSPFSSSSPPPQTVTETSACSTATATTPPQMQQQQQMQQQHTTSIVHSMLQMVDMSCMAAGLMPDDQNTTMSATMSLNGMMHPNPLDNSSSSSHHSRTIILHTPSILATEEEEEEEEDYSTIGLNEWGKPPALKQPYRSKPPPPKKASVRRQENFELVYQEPLPLNRKTNTKQQQQSSNKLAKFFAQQKTKRSTLGISARSTTTTTTTTTTKSVSSFWRRSSSRNKMDQGLSHQQSNDDDDDAHPRNTTIGLAMKKLTQPTKQNNPTTASGGFLHKTFSKYSFKAANDSFDQSSASPKTNKRTTRSTSPIRTVLHSIKSGSVLETVPEEQEDLKVSVPGDPHTILSGKDLIGSEVVEEIYSQLFILDETTLVPEETITTTTTPSIVERSTNADTATSGKATTTTAYVTSHLPIPELTPEGASIITSPLPTKEQVVVSETSQVVYSSSPKRQVSGEGYQKFESDDDDDEAELFVTTTKTKTATNPKAQKSTETTTTANENVVTAVEGTVVSSSLPRPRSWKEKLGLSKSGSSSENNNNNNNNNETLIAMSKIASAQPQPPPKKPMWKSVVDPATGRTYYYHRKTRETTWNKPKDEDLMVVAPKQLQTQTAKTTAAAQQNAESAQNAEIQRLVGLLPSDSIAVDKLMQDYQGESLIHKLQEHLETSSQPFDEPVVTTTNTKVRSDEKSIENKTQAAATIYSGFSSSHKSRISEKTLPIQNTTRQRRAAVLSSSSSSSPLQPQVVPTISPRPDIPRNIPVPRLRELEVEEFSSLRNERNLRNPPRLLGTQINRDPTAKHPSIVKVNEDDVNYMGDAENNDLEEEDEEEEEEDRESYAATDSISALSEDNLSFIDRKEAYDDVRRRALHRAIAQQDWDLAAQMTVQLKERPPAKLSATKPKHAISEIDRLMAENNWGAVSHYIENARVRARQTERHRINQHLGRIDRPQKRFGARSQLQHTSLYSNIEEDEDDEESGVSEYTSESDSSEGNGLAPPRARARKPKEFAC